MISMQGLVSWVEGFPKEPLSGDGIDKDIEAEKELSAELIGLTWKVYRTGEKVCGIGCTKTVISV